MSVQHYFWALRFKNSFTHQLRNCLHDTHEIHPAPSGNTARHWAAAIAGASRVTWTTSVRQYVRTLAATSRAVAVCCCCYFLATYLVLSVSDSFVLTFSTVIIRIYSVPEYERKYGQGYTGERRPIVAVVLWDLRWNVDGPDCKQSGCNRTTLVRKWPRHPPRWWWVRPIRWLPLISETWTSSSGTWTWTLRTMPGTWLCRTDLPV